MGDEDTPFSPSRPTYNILPNAEPLKYAISLKLSSALLDYISQDPQGRLSICFGPKQRLMFNGQNFDLQVTEENKQKPNYCYQESPHDFSFSKVGVIKKKLLTKQEELRDEDIAKFQHSNQQIAQEKEARKIIQIDSTIGGEGRKRKAAAVVERKQIRPNKRNRAAVTPAAPPASTPVATPTPTPAATPAASAVSGKGKKLPVQAKPKVTPMPKFPKTIPTTVPDPYSTPVPPKPKLALQPHLIQLLALEGLTMTQISEKRPEGTRLIQNILSKIAACKGAVYHLKPKFYKEVDLSWEGYTPEEKARVEDNVNNAASLEMEQAQAAPLPPAKVEAAGEKESFSPPSAPYKPSPEKPVEQTSVPQKDGPVVQLDLGDDESQSLKIDLSDHGEDSVDEVLAGSVVQAPPSPYKPPNVEQEKPHTATNNGIAKDVKPEQNGRDRRSYDISDYKLWKSKWDLKYPIYRELCKELEENRKLFEKLGTDLHNAVTVEEQQRVAALVEKFYNERNEDMQKKNRRYKKLHEKLKVLKSNLVDCGNRMKQSNNEGSF